MYKIIHGFGFRFSLRLGKVLKWFTFENSYGLFFNELIVNIFDAGNGRIFKRDGSDDEPNKA